MRIPAIALAAALAALGSAPALAEPDPYQALAQRAVAGDNIVPMSVMARATTPGFAFPIPLPAELPLMGSVWPTLAPFAWTRLYYEASLDTNAVVRRLRDQLRAAGYTPRQRSGYPDLFVGDSPFGEIWCPPAGSFPDVHLVVSPAVSPTVPPALELAFYQNGGACAVRSAPTATPAFGNIAGMKIDPTLRGSSGGDGSIFSTAIITTKLSARETMSRLSDAVVAAGGWTPESIVEVGGTVAQRFASQPPGKPWYLTIVLEPLRGGAYRGLTDLVYDSPYR